MFSNNKKFTKIQKYCIILSSKTRTGGDDLAWKQDVENVTKCLKTMVC